MSDWVADQRLRTLLEESGPDLLAYFQRRLEVREDAADLLAETAVVVWRRIHDVPSGPEGRLWLFGVAGNVLANHQRSARRRQALVTRLRREIRRDRDVRPSEAEEMVRSAVARLAPEHRELVRLIHWDGFNVAEAANILGLNASTARSRYGVARGLLREALDLRSTAVS